MVYNNIKNKHHTINGYINKHKGLQRRHINTKSTITFLIKCRKSGNIPNFIQNETKNVSKLFKTHVNLPEIQNSLTRVLNTFHIKLLNLLIKQKHEIEKDLNLSKNGIRANINSFLTVDEQSQLWTSEEAHSKKIMAETKDRHRKKLKILQDTQRVELQINENDNWFVNKTNTHIPENVQWLLSLGQKHALPTVKHEFPLFKYIADGEDCIQTIDDKEEQELARSKFTSILENHVNKQSLSMRDRYTVNIVDEADRFLRKHKDIFILNADKGNVTVAMDRSAYELRMGNILSDMMTYRRLIKDPTSSLQKKNNELVDELHKCNIISVIEKRRLKNDAALAPRIYGLPKIHKEDFPLRPICSSVNSPSIKLCKLLTKILEKLTADSVFNVKDAVQFRTKLKNCTIDEDEKLVSFDVISLFPSIPVDYAIEVIKEKWNEIEKHTAIPKELFFKILKFCIKDSRYFKYKDKIYTQHKGLPMGSPASPIVADIVMEELLKKCYDNLSCKPRFLTKYVDDLFGIVKESAIQSTLEELNNFHHQIRFTVDIECNGKLPYLDTLLIRDSNTITFDWYQKPTASGRIINYYSNQPKNIIINTANNLCKRVLNISDESFHQENIKRIKKILEKNSFPENIINRIIKMNTTQTKQKPDITPKIYKSMIYVPVISERLRNAGIYNNEKYRLAPKTINTLRKLFTKTKSKIEKFDKSNLVYKIPCAGDGINICTKVYVGTTKNKLKTRLAGHKSDLKCRTNTTIQKTALADHCAMSTHTPNYDITQILQTENNYNRRLILEMLHINNVATERRMNTKRDTDNLAQIYRHMINKKKM